MVEARPPLGEEQSAPCLRLWFSFPWTFPRQHQPFDGQQLDELGQAGGG
jgi:hypothetical protein